MMSGVRVLYGKKIVPHHMLNYAEQIYDILVSEIEGGRWKIDDRLPGVIALAKELGFGTKTVQTAYDRLREDGYVRSLGYRGTYLKATHPLSSAADGKIGVLVAEEQAGQDLILWYEHVILQRARRRGLVSEVKTWPADRPPGEVMQPAAIFGPNTRGMVALTPFRAPFRFGDDPAALPLVFLVPPYEACLPKVCADVREAYYDLTCRLIRYGHRNIVFSEDSVEPDPRQTALHREGYLEAMQEHGGAVDQDLMEDARRVRNADAESVAAHLLAIKKKPKARRATAVVAGSLGRSAALVRAAPLHRIRVPEDLSIASIGSASVEGDNGRQLTGMLPDFDLMVDLCLDMLDQQRERGSSDYTNVYLRMHFVEGHTVRPCGGSGSPALPDR